MQIHRLKYLLPLFLLCGWVSHIASAQQVNNEQLEAKALAFKLSNPNQILYVQTDKEVYTGNETIWMAAYLFNFERKDTNKADLISVMLVNDQKQPVLESNFLVKNELSAGSLRLPDSIKPGTYQLVAYSNLRKGNDPLYIFRKPLVIRSTQYQQFTLKYNVLPVQTHTDSMKLAMEVSITDYNYITFKDKFIWEYWLKGQKRRRYVLDASYQKTISIPLSDLVNTDHILYTAAYCKSDTQYFNFQLPRLERDTAMIQCFPEGGDLVEGLESVVACEVVSQHGKPLSQVQLGLFMNETLIDSFYTDARGLTRFHLLPKPGQEYRVRLLDSKSLYKEFLFPAALSTGVVLFVKNGVAKDTLLVSVQTTQPTSIRVAFIDQNDHATVFSEPISVKKIRDLILPLPAVAKGLNSITLIDSLGRPLAERVFFAHYDQYDQVTIRSHKQQYEKRDSVHLSITLADEQKQPLEAVFSVAVVRNDRLARDPVIPGIKAYYYLNEWIRRNMVVSDSMYVIKEYLNDVLLTKGWRRYTWQRMAEQQEDRISPPLRLVHPYARITQGKRSIAEKMSVMFMLIGKWEPFTSDSKGYIRMPMEAIAVPDQRTAYLKIIDKDPYKFIIAVFDSLNITNRRIAANIPAVPVSLRQQPVIQSTREQFVNDPQYTRLPEVIVKARDNSSLLAFNGGPGPNACGDFVCRYGILNCPRMQPPLTAPIEGKIYKDDNNRPIYYYGCAIDKEQSIVPFNIIRTAREFYPLNAAELALSKMENLSTLFWQPFVFTDKQGKAAISFYTSDMSGPYIVQVNGMTMGGEFIQSRQLLLVK